MVVNEQLLMRAVCSTKCLVCLETRWAVRKQIACWQIIHLSSSGNSERELSPQSVVTRFKLSVTRSQRPSLSLSLFLRKDNAFENYWLSFRLEMRARLKSCSGHLGNFGAFTPERRLWYSRPTLGVLIRLKLQLTKPFLARALKY